MTLNPNWPLLTCQVAFNSGVATPATPAWSDLTPRLWSLGCDRGRQYELDQNQAGTGQLVFADSDETLNPTNPAGAFYPNVLPYRQICVQAMWPPAPVGGAVNLLNAAAGQGFNPLYGPYDPSFESYAVGSAVPWLSHVGIATPVVDNTTPRTGSRNVSWTVGSISTPQGASWLVPCIPGQQYTASAYVRQSSASTQMLAIPDAAALIAKDSFGRTAANSWGTPDVGPAYTLAGGTAAEFNVAGGLGAIAVNSVGATRQAILPVTVADIDHTFQLRTGALAVGAYQGVAFMLRRADANNYLFAEARFFPNQSIDMALVSRVGGAETELFAIDTGVTHVAAQFYNMRVQLIGAQWRAKLWVAGTQEPATWIASVGNATTITAPNAIGYRVVLASGYTGTLPVTVGFDGASTTGGVLGTSTTATGAYQRLTATWTATQPVHTVQLATVGTAVFGQVYLDDVQHEPGGAASAFTTSGPVIYGVHRGFVERWPSTWKHRGMYGYAQVDTVDAFAVLAARKLHTEFHTSVFAKAPDYYWALNEPQGATLFAEDSGHQGPPLAAAASSHGVGSATVTAGSQTAIAGDPGGVGVAVASQTQFSGVGYAIKPTVPNAVAGGGNTASWGMTLMAWYSGTQSGADYIVSCFGTDASSPGFAVPTPQLQMLGGGQPFLTVSTSSVSVSSTPTSKNYSDGRPHLYIGRFELGSDNSFAMKLWVDGQLVSSFVSLSTSSLFGTSTPNLATSTIQVCGQVDSYINGPGPAGIYSHVGLWRRALSTTEIADLWNAGTGVAGESSGARISRYLSYVGYGGATAIDSGQSVMGASALAEGTGALDACLGVTLSENGNFWADSTGTLTFAARSRRYLATSAMWVFGENTAGGELPYEDDIAYDYDPSQIFNDIQVSNASGVTAEVQDTTSQANYGPRSLQRSINVLSDNEAIDAANWLLATHKDPRQRISTLTIKPSHNPALWPVALGAEVGDRVTVRRRTLAGYTMQADYFIEQISHQQGPDSWTTQFQMSPAFPAPAWILGDATYGLLGSTTTLGY